MDEVGPKMHLRKITLSEEILFNQHCQKQQNTEHNKSGRHRYGVCMFYQTVPTSATTAYAEIFVFVCINLSYLSMLTVFMRCTILSGHASAGYPHQIRVIYQLRQQENTLSSSAVIGTSDLQEIIDGKLFVG